MKTLLMTLIMMMGLSAQSQITIEEIAPRWKTGSYSTGSTLAHRFDNPTYVERMLISAEGYRDFSKVYVYADGDLVSVLGVPGRDPEYPVIVRKTISSIVMKFEGHVRILDFRLYIGETYSNENFYSQEYANLDTPAELGKAVLKVVGDLQNYVSDKEFKTYLLPLRKSALVLAAKGMGRPLLSDNTQRQARIMVFQIHQAENFILGRLSESQYFTQQVQTLLFVKEKLESVYELPRAPQNRE